MDKITKFLIWGVVGFVVLSILFSNIVGIVKIEGNEVAVIQDWSKGILDKTLVTGTHFYNNVAWDVYKYDIGTQKITFDSNPNNRDAEWESIPVEVGENGGQKAMVVLSCNYRLNPSKIISIHKEGIGRNYESVVLKREIVDVVNEISRPNRSVLDIYSGKGFVDFKNSVDKALRDSEFLKNKGLDIENTIIYGVRLDPKYEEEIAGKQIAQQQALRKQEETKAAQEEAKRIFAFSQAQVEKVRQEAEAQKIVVVTKAHADAEQQVLQAEGEKKKRILEAEGERDANLAKALGLIAVGEAEAKVITLKTNALYVGEPGERRAKVEVAAQKAAMMKELLNHITVLPEKTFAKIGEAGNVIASVDLYDKDDIK